MRKLALLIIGRGAGPRISGKRNAGARPAFASRRASRRPGSLAPVCADTSSRTESTAWATIRESCRRA